MLREYLVPIETLQPTTDNPRRGNVDRIAASLRAFGQRRPILVEGATIIAGHHLTQAAEALGWTHIAAMADEFGDAEEARAYMLADNRTHDAGGYDEPALARHLEALAELDRLHGTGYTADDLDELQDRLREHEQAARPPGRHAGGVGGELVEQPLVLTRDQYDQLSIWRRIVEQECGTIGLSEAVYAGMEIAAQQLNS